MEFSLTTLGVGSASPTSNRYPSAHVLNVRGRLFLIDCGEGCQMLLKRHHFSILKFECIFLSHLHGDHIFGLFGLLATMSMMGRTANLDIFAPKEFTEMLDFYLSKFGGEFKYTITHHILDFTEPQKIFETPSLDVFAFPLNHVTTTFGFLFKEKEPELNVYKEQIEKLHLSVAEIGKLKSGFDISREDGTLLSVSENTYKPFLPRSFAYCSDTAPFEQLTDWIKGVNLLYHEATFASDMAEMAQSTTHSTTIQAAENASKAEVGKLVIGHFSSRYNDPAPLLEEVRAIFPHAFLAKEGETFHIPMVIPSSKNN